MFDVRCSMLLLHLLQALTPALSRKRRGRLRGGRLSALAGEGGHFFSTIAKRYFSVATKRVPLAATGVEKTEPSNSVVPSSFFSFVAARHTTVAFSVPM